MAYSETPLMKQFNAIKQKYPGAILLFRVGDFYETFGEDAIITSKILGIVLTKRGNGSASETALAGFPYHSLDTYLPKLVKAGKRVAVCDQLEDPKMAKGIVKRGITELVSPGVTLNDKILESGKNNYLASVYCDVKEEIMGLAFIDVSTGDFFCLKGDTNYADKILATLSPSEILVAKKDFRHFTNRFGEKYYVTKQDDWIFKADYAQEKLLSLFKTHSLKGFGIEKNENGIIAAGAILHYLNENQQHHLGHVTKIYAFNDTEFVWLDPFTIRNLELVQPLHSEGVTLSDILDFTLTPMGARALRQAICFPLKDISMIEQRLNTVEGFLTHQNEFDSLKGFFKKLGDLERIASKVATQRLQPREAVMLRESLKLVNPIKDLLKTFNIPHLQAKIGDILPVEEVLEVLEKYLMDEIGTSIQEGNVIRKGVNEELDELRKLQKSGKDFLDRKSVV